MYEFSLIMTDVVLDSLMRIISIELKKKCPRKRRPCSKSEDPEKDHALEKQQEEARKPVERAPASHRAHCWRNIERRLTRSQVLSVCWGLSASTCSRRTKSPDVEIEKSRAYGLTKHS